ncbi:unknown [Clostridium sp. CAG:813]|nr:unknown [Clostridium sp. CAG:813]
MDNDVSNSPAPDSSVSYIELLIAWLMIESASIKLVTAECFCALAINVGIVIAATTPIIPNVINTSASVNPFVFR